MSLQTVLAATQNLRRLLSLHKLVGQIAISAHRVDWGKQNHPADAPTAFPTKTGLTKSKETARVVVGMIATAPYFFDGSSTTCLLNGPSITFDDGVSRGGPRKTATIGIRPALLPAWKR